jgi:asparagine synthase (glutamine-hydrolysing)
MCGIGGVFVRRPENPGTLRQRGRSICEALSHRGPDDHGSWIDENSGLVLAHTRLSIIDLSQHGHQPMVSRDGRYVISFNGEIYNHNDLATELNREGVQLSGHSDTESALELIATLGLESAVRQFDGMFAFALWDRRERCLHLVRDRLGIKPLYYGKFSGAWVFGSELKALSGIPEWTREIDRNALGEYMRYGYVPDQSCIFRGMSKVAPGTITTIPFDDGRSTSHTFWSLAESIQSAPPSRLPIDKKTAVDLIHTELRESVRQRMAADVPIGVFLSGGLDSSLIASITQSLSPTPIRTFTIGFKEPEFDESEYAKAISAKLGTRHSSVMLSATDALGLIPELPGVYDEPFADPSQLPTILVSRLAASEVKVVLSGDGGDELFGGYTRYESTARHWRRIAALPKALRSLLASVLNTASNSSRVHNRVLRLVSLLRAYSRPDFYHQAISMLNDVSRILPSAKNTDGRFLESASLAALASIEEEMMYTDTITYLPGDILTKVDRASMSTGLEVRVPFLHHKVVEAVWSLALENRINPMDPKDLIKAILDEYLDRSLFERPKKGFAVPLAQWLRGPLRPWAEDLMASETPSSTDFFRPQALETSWQLLLKGKDNQTNIVWNALTFLAWKRSWNL